MKKLIAKHNIFGSTAKLDAKKTYQSDFGKWIAEVDGTEFNHACDILCEGIEGCTCDDLHIEADQDDDGKEYSFLKR